MKIKLLPAAVVIIGGFIVLYLRHTPAPTAPSTSPDNAAKVAPTSPVSNVNKVATSTPPSGVPLAETPAPPGQPSPQNPTPKPERTAPAESQLVINGYVVEDPMARI